MNRLLNIESFTLDGLASLIEVVAPWRLDDGPMILSRDLGL